MIKNAASAVLAVAALGLVGNGPMAGAAGSKHTAVQPAHVSPGRLGVDPSSATAPWRAQVLADGSVQLVWGDIAQVPSDPNAIAESSGAASPESANPIKPARNWYCEVHYAYPTTLSGSELRSAHEVRCHNVARHRVDWKFQRSSWSGYRDYTSGVTGGWGTAVLNAQTIRTRCGRGGTYDYRGAFVSVAQPTIGDTRKSPTYFTSKGRYTCGTGVS